MIHLDVVLVSARSLLFRQDELDTAQVVETSGQTLQRASFRVKDASFARGIEFELNAFRFRPRFWDFEGHAEPMAVVQDVLFSCGWNRAFPRLRLTLSTRVQAKLLSEPV